MLEVMAVAASAANGGALNWADLGLVPGIDLGFFTLRFYSLAYLAGLVFACTTAVVAQVAREARPAIGLGVALVREVT